MIHNRDYLSPSPNVLDARISKLEIRNYYTAPVLDTLLLQSSNLTVTKLVLSNNQ